MSCVPFVLVLHFYCSLFSQQVSLFALNFIGRKSKIWSRDKIPQLIGSIYVWPSPYIQLKHRSINQGYLYTLETNVHFTLGECTRWVHSDSRHRTRIRNLYFNIHSIRLGIRPRLEVWSHCRLHGRIPHKSWDFIGSLNTDSLRSEFVSIKIRRSPCFGLGNLFTQSLLPHLVHKQFWQFSRDPGPCYRAV